MTNTATNFAALAPVDLPAKTAAALDGGGARGLWAAFRTTSNLMSVGPNPDTGLPELQSANPKVTDAIKPKYALTFAFACALIASNAEFATADAAPQTPSSRREIYAEPREVD